MIDYGIKVANLGDDVATATDKDLIFTTKYSTLKIYKSGTLGFTTGTAGDGLGSSAHNLGYAPAFMAFRKDTASWSFMSGGTTYGTSYLPVGGVNYWASDDLHHALHAYADGTNMYIQAKGASASKAYEFKYYLLADLSADYDGTSGVTSLKDYGMKVSQDGIDVKTARDYELAYSSRFHSLQYYDVNVYSATLTLNQMFASKEDNDVEQGDFVDIVHGLGYPPFFLAHFDGTVNKLLEIPYDEEDGQDIINFSVAGFADPTRIRFSWWRRSRYFDSTNTLYGNWSAGTITIKCYAFTEDLTAGTYG